MFIKMLELHSELRDILPLHKIRGVMARLCFEDASAKFGALASLHITE
jgi:hypothetical protein